MPTGKTVDSPSVPESTQRHVTAGPRARAAFEMLLGLSRSMVGWRLDGLCIEGEVDASIRVGLTNGRRRIAFHLLTPDSGAAPLSSGHFTLAAQYPGSPGAQKLLSAFAARLHGQRMHDLTRLILGDADSFSQRVRPGSGGDRVKVPCIGQPISLLEDGWRNFFADQDFEVLLGVPVCSTEKTVNVEYADLECFYSRPKLSFGKWTFLDWPEQSDDGVRGVGGEAGGANIVAELEERDMIMGTGERAEALVESVRARAEAGNFILFTHLCTPIVMGEDLSGLARRCEEAVGGSAVRWSQKDRDENDNFGAYFRALAEKPGFFKDPCDREAVNLFHFPKPLRDRELRPFLTELGLKINVCAFPDVNFPDLERLPEALWQVFCQRSSYPTKVREILTGASRSVVTVRAPYGVEGTRECLRAVASATGKMGAFDEAWSVRMREFLPAWDALRGEACGLRLAFVVSEATLPRLWTLRYGHGAPLAAMVQEMGFGVDILYYDLHGEPPQHFESLQDARIRVFRSPWELREALRDDDFHAVYSDIFFDRRLNDAGKARFASRDFEMGLEGARRTLERLLSVCHLPFYRRYAEHLSGPRGNDRGL